MCSYSLGKSIRSKLKLNISNCVHTVRSFVGIVISCISLKIFKQTLLLMFLPRLYIPPTPNSYHTITKQYHLYGKPRTIPKCDSCTVSLLKCISLYQDNLTCKTFIKKVCLTFQVLVVYSTVDLSI